jgi:integrase
MTRIERDAFFKAAERGGEVQYVFIRTAYETASRVTETLHLQWSDVDFKSKTIHVIRIKGSKTVVADISDRLVERLGNLSRKSALIFPGKFGCEERPKGQIRPRKSGMAWEHCPGGHLRRRLINAWIEIVGRTIELEPGLRHPHTLKHTRLCDEARLYKQDGGAAMIAAVKRLSGHASDSALMIYLDEPEMVVVKSKKSREALNAVG